MNEFLNFIAEIMDVNPSEISGETEYGIFSKWDSLMHMRLIMETEERYDIEIPIDEIANIKKLKDLYAYIQEDKQR